MIEPKKIETHPWIVIHENELRPEWFKTEKEALDAAHEIAQGYLQDGEWSDGAASVIVAEIKHRATEFKVDPPDHYDEDYPAPYDYYCDYVMQPVKS